jgi:hypothetical protein
VSPESEQLVRDTWAKVLPSIDKVVGAFYARLFESNPEAARLFSSTNMVEQRKKFAMMLAEIVRVLDRPELLVSEVAASDDDTSAMVYTIAITRTSARRCSGRSSITSATRSRQTSAPRGVRRTRCWPRSCSGPRIACRER